MTRRVTRKSTTLKAGTEIRHQYAPADIGVGEAWKVTFPLTEPLINVTLDRGTFEWLWDFTSRKGRQADASNFHYSDIHRSVYQRAANQFALAAKEALGETYAVTPNKPASKKPVEAPVAPAKRRGRRKPAETTATTFEAPEELTEAPKRKRRRRSRSAA